MESSDARREGPKRAPGPPTQRLNGRRSPNSQPEAVRGAIVTPSDSGTTAVRGAPDARITAVSWTASADMNQHRWLEHGRQIVRAHNASAWWLGDWLRWGFLKFGERYRTAARVTGYDQQTLMNYAYVAGRFAPETRRLGVPWSHHAEVAKLDARERDYWLDRIARERLSVRDIRVELRSRDAVEPLAAVSAASVGRSCCPACGQRLPGRSPRDPQIAR